MSRTALQVVGNLGAAGGTAILDLRVGRRGESDAATTLVLDSKSSESILEVVARGNGVATAVRRSTRRLAGGVGAIRVGSVGAVNGINAANVGIDVESPSARSIAIAATLNVGDGPVGVRRRSVASSNGGSGRDGSGGHDGGNGGLSELHLD